MNTALIFGGSGQIGLAVTRGLADAGWTVTAATRAGQRLPREIADRGIAHVDGDQPRTQVIAATGKSYDVIVDATAYDVGDAGDLIRASTRAGALVVMSSSSVYADSHGRSLDEASSGGFPDFQGPMTEDTPIVKPGPETYSTRKVAMELALRGARVPVTILRPCALYGKGARHFREWWFIRRALDQRKATPVAYNGESRFHTSSATELAKLVEIVLRNPKHQTLNVAGPTAVSVSEIARAIAAAIDLPISIRPFPGPPEEGSLVGSTPWSAALICPRCNARPESRLEWWTWICERHRRTMPVGAPRHQRETWRRAVRRNDARLQEPC